MKKIEEFLNKYPKTVAAVKTIMTWMFELTIAILGFLAIVPPEVLTILLSV
jgi:hypothetical protein